MIKFLMFPILLFSTFCFVFYKEEIEVKEEIKTGYLKEGIEKLNNKKYEEALSIFNKAKEENKELSSFYIFYTNYLLKRYEEAIKEGNKFLTHFPSSSLVDKVFYLLGISYENENFYIRAAQNFLNAYKKTDDIRIKKDSEKRFERIIKKLNFNEIKSILKDAEETPFYSETLYYAFLSALKENKIIERDSIYNELKEIGGKYFKEVENILKREKRESRGEYVFKILLLIPLTGEFGEYGKEFLNGFNLSFPDNNLIEIFDTRSDPSYLYNSMNLFLEKKPYIIVGPLSTKCATVIFPFLSKEKIIVISPTASDIRLGTIGDNIFAFNEGIYYEIKKISDFMLLKEYKKIGILYASVNECEISKDVFIQIFKKNKEKEVFSISYSPDSTDYQKEIKEIRKFSPDAILLFPSEEKDAIEMITQIKFLKISCPIFSTHYLLREKSVIVAGEQLKDVYISGSYPFPLTNLMYEEFNEKYIKNYNISPGIVAIRGYETGLLLKEIVSYGIKDFYRIKDFLNAKGFLNGLMDFYSWNEEIIRIYNYEKDEFKEVYR